MELPVTFDENVWNNRLGKANADRKMAHDIKERNLPIEERTEYQPLTLQEHVQSIISATEEEYSKAIEKEVLDEVRADPTQFRRLMAALTIPELRQKLSDLIDAETQQ